MAIELKFRGLNKINNTWCYGDLIHVDGKAERIFIFGESSYFIKPETVGLYTGLKDKNGKEIYVSDILSDKWVVEVYQNDEGTFMVKFHNNPIKNKSMTLKRYLSSREIAGCGERDCVVIGSTHKNPELLNIGARAF